MDEAASRDADADDEGARGKDEGRSGGGHSDSDGLTYAQGPRTCVVKPVLNRVPCWRSQWELNSVTTASLPQNIQTGQAGVAWEGSSGGNEV